MTGFSSGKLALAVCDRCNRKRPYGMLRADGNSNGLRVCSDGDCYDIFNPWRLPPIQPDPISLKYPRPDTDISTTSGNPYKDLTNDYNPVPPNEGDYPT